VNEPLENRRDPQDDGRGSPELIDSCIGELVDEPR
jgi:hypothetical protein